MLVYILKTAISQLIVPGWAASEKKFAVLSGDYGDTPIVISVTYGRELTLHFQQVIIIDSP